MRTVKQFLRFGIVGLSNTVLGYIVYAIALKLMRLNCIYPEYDIYIAQFIMFVLSVAWSFHWNNKFVFNDKKKSVSEIIILLIRTYISYGFTSFVLSELLLILWVSYLEIDGYIAPLLNLLVTVPLNFILQKFWTFKSPKQHKDGE